MIICVYRALDWPSSTSRTKVIAHKPRCTQNSKNAEKAWVSHWRHFCKKKTAASYRSRAIRDPRERLV